MIQPVKAPAGLAKWQLTRALDYIEQHLPDKITIEELARLVGVSCHWFQRAFKISVGIPPYRFIARRRLALACMLLKTTREPLSQVALSCGLYDHSHFSRVFRRGTGMNPAAWRRANAVAPGLHRQGTLASLQS
jgi:AraC family transcriptional regulator